jgi:hypothetical protein
VTVNTSISDFAIQLFEQMDSSTPTEEVAREIDAESTSDIVAAKADEVDENNQEAAASAKTTPSPSSDGQADAGDGGKKIVKNNCASGNVAVAVDAINGEEKNKEAATTNNDAPMTSQQNWKDSLEKAQQNLSQKQIIDADEDAPNKSKLLDKVTCTFKPPLDMMIKIKYGSNDCKFAYPPFLAQYIHSVGYFVLVLIFSQ